MDAIDTFKRDLEEHSFRRNARKRLIIITVSVIILVTVIITTVFGVLGHTSSKKNQVSSSATGTTESIKAVCQVTLYPNSCSSSIASLKSSSNATLDDPGALFLLSLEVALNELVKLANFPQMLIDSNITNDSVAKNALIICERVFWDAIDYVQTSIASTQMKFEGKYSDLFMSTSTINDIRTWLSAAITYQETCLDGLMEYSEINPTIIEEVKIAMQNSTEFTSNSLAIVTKILTVFQAPVNRKLLHTEANGFPSYFYSGGERRLLQKNVKKLPKPNVTVAKDGTGDFRTINEAVKMIPEKSKSRFVIYIKEGVYTENVFIGKSLWNVTMYGDGMDKTIITGRLNKIDGTDTFDSGTLIAEGRGLILMYMCIRNTAGPEKRQAVAMRSSSDRSIFYRCSFNAYQDTLYTHANRQYYRDCHITGTVDFIFGNAAVVFQNCTVQPRQPMPGQFITITAQSKSDANQNTGTSIQKCLITTTLNNVNLTALTYLGRPWKNHSTTVIMQSNLGKFLNPVGWAEWEPNLEPPRTIFYGEYKNSGPGSVLDKRVDWDGYRRNLTDDQAGKFTVEALIQGSEWLMDHARLFNYNPNL